MYKEHKIQCASCGKVFISELNDTLCKDCFKSTSNRSKPIEK